MFTCAARSPQPDQDADGPVQISDRDQGTATGISEWVGIRTGNCWRAALGAVHRRAQPTLTPISPVLHPAAAVRYLPADAAGGCPGGLPLTRPVDEEQDVVYLTRSLTPIPVDWEAAQEAGFALKRPGKNRSGCSVGELPHGGESQKLHRMGKILPPGFYGKPGAAGCLKSPAPTIAPSAIGVSSTRASPNLRCSPSVTRNTPPRTHILAEHDHVRVAREHDVHRGVERLDHVHLRHGSASCSARISSRCLRRCSGSSLNTSGTSGRGSAADRR